MGIKDLLHPRIAIVAGLLLLIKVGSDRLFPESDLTGLPLLGVGLCIVVLVLLCERAWKKIRGGKPA